MHLNSNSEIFLQKKIGRYVKIIEKYSAKAAPKIGKIK